MALIVVPAIKTNRIEKWQTEKWKTPFPLSNTFLPGGRDDADRRLPEWY